MEALEEVFWYLRQYSRELLEFQRTIQAFWDDSASRDITSRYLNPHHQENEHFIGAVSEEIGLLTQAEEALSLASEHARATGEMSIKVIDLFELIDEDAQTSGHHAARSSELREKAQGELLAARKLCGEAIEAVKDTFAPPSIE